VPVPVMIPIGIAREHKLKGVEAARITQDEVHAFLESLFGSFHGELHPEDLRLVGAAIEPERSLAVRDDGQIVGTAGIYTRRMTVPGGEVPVAAVTMVGVRASHRRRGLLTTMMRRQLSDVHEAGIEPVAALWASEGAIYGRFGYGMAALAAQLDVVVREARLREPPEARARLGSPEAMRTAMSEIYEAARGLTAGMLDRSSVWWDRRTADPEHQRHGAGPLRAAVVDGEAYAMYSVKMKFESSGPAGQVDVREVVAATPEGSAAIWRFLLELDLTRRLVYDLAASDDPLLHLVAEAQSVGARIGEGLWVRVVDVPAALAARGYAMPFEVVLEVSDEFCPWNAGRWALTYDGTTAACERTTAPAGLELTVAELGAAYLGGTTFEVLARARRVRELRAGALATASAAFRGERAPWCPEVF
jgi:predicted acetyltransferase